MKQNNTIMVEETNKDFEDWANDFCGNFDKFMEEEHRRMKKLGLVSGLIFDNEEYDHIFDEFNATFELKKDEIKDYVYVDKLISCRHGNESEYINRTYKFIRMEGDYCAIFYRDY